MESHMCELICYSLVYLTNSSLLLQVVNKVFSKEKISQRRFSAQPLHYPKSHKDPKPISFPMIFSHTYYELYQMLLY